MDNARRNHWENVYETKNADQLSWTQKVPEISLDFIHSFHLAKSAKIIDIGGGDSRLVDYLLTEGFENITVLDISSKAIEKAKQRLGNNAEKVNWVNGDILEFQPDTIFDLWHDRATFHFLLTKGQIERYIRTARESISGYLIIGTFSETGPKKCSGLNVSQYTEETLSIELQKGFDKLRCIHEDHVTPFNTLQNFLFCSFKRNLNLE
jgi:hypothetical protein